MPKQEPRAWLVTGANRGIGLVFARLLCERGDRVIATARHPERARELAKLPVRLEQLDVADEKSIIALAGRIEGEPLDVLINNAGIGEAGPQFGRLSMKELEEAFRVNAAGPVALAQALLSNLRAGKRRAIVNLSSDLGSISRTRAEAGSPTALRRRR